MKISKINIVYVLVGLMILLGVVWIFRSMTIPNSPQETIVDASGTLPAMKVQVFGKTAPGNIYTSNFTLHSYVKHFVASDEIARSHAFIFNKNGEILKTHEFKEPYGFNFQKNPNGGYVYAQGFLADSQKFSDKKHPQGESWVFLDEDLVETDRYHVQNTLHTDGHEITFLDNGNYLLISYEYQKEENITVGLLQEITLEREVVWEWDSINYIGPEESYSSLLEFDSTDYTHINSVLEDDDGNLIVSMRNTSQIIKINRETSEIMWRLGGKRSDFKFTEDPYDGFSAQHHAQILDNGNILLYDNGNQHNPQQTRVIEYELDEEEMTARLVWSYLEPGVFTPFAGSVQRLDNGHTFIGWGGRSAESSDLVTQITEINQENKVVLEIDFPENMSIYRAYKY